MHPVLPQPSQVNSAANKSWLINYVEAALPRHIINALTSTQAAPGEDAHKHTLSSDMKTYTTMDKHTRLHWAGRTDSSRVADRIKTNQNYSDLLSPEPAETSTDDILDFCSCPLFFWHLTRPPASPLSSFSFCHYFKTSLSKSDSSFHRHMKANFWGGGAGCHDSQPRLWNPLLQETQILFTIQSTENR